MKKKVLYFCFLFACFVFGMQSLVFLAYADEEANPVINLNNENFQTALTLSGNFALTENINLTGLSWSPIENFSGTLDGNGFIITTDNYLFSSINNATVKNLGIVFEDEQNFYISNTSISSSFGMLAKSCDASVIEECFVKGDFNVVVNASSYIGGIVGKVDNGTIIKNCYTNVDINVTQQSSLADCTAIGGLLGYCNNSIVQNCFSLGTINCDVDVEATSLETDFLIGGFVGQVNGSEYLSILNSITSCESDCSYSGTNVFVGKVFGEVKSCQDKNVNHIYALSEQSLPLIAKTNSCALSTVLLKDLTFFDRETEFLNNENWNCVSYWDFDTVWCKKTGSQLSELIVLQAFENFEVVIETNEQGVECLIYEKEGVDFVLSEGNVFKCGTIVKLVANIEDAFKNYKTVLNIEHLEQSSNENVDLVFNEDKSSASFEFSVNSKNSGKYRVGAEKILYNLIVKTKDKNSGKIKYSSSSLQSSITRQVEYDSSTPYNFSAEQASNGYAFEKWVWIDESDDNKEIPVVKGTSENVFATSKTLDLVFGEAQNNLAYIYFNIDNVPYTEDELGNKTFVLQANFTTNVGVLKIKSLLSETVCGLKVDGETINITDPEVLFEGAIQIGKTIEIEIITTDENYKFDDWNIEAGKNFSNYVAEDETTKSQIIHLTLSGDLELTANFLENSISKFDWMLLAYIGGGIGALGLLTFIVIAIIRKSKKDDFLNYY